MAGASDFLENAILEHILNNLTIANVGDATGLRGSATAGSLYLSLHTADPTDAGNQSSNEVNYTSYARVAVARNGSVWTVTGNSAVGTQQSFPTGTGGSGVATHFGLGTAVSGSGSLLFVGAITPNITCGNGVTPRITPTITVD